HADPSADRRRFDEGAVGRDEYGGRSAVRGRTLSAGSAVCRGESHAGVVAAIDVAARPLRTGRAGRPRETPPGRGAAARTGGRAPAKPSAARGAIAISPNASYETGALP